MTVRGAKPTDSTLEVDLGRRLRAEKFTGFVTQHEVFDGDEYVMRVDFAWVKLRIAVHADSYSFHQQRERFERDARQRTRLAGMGWTMIMVTKEMLENETGWVLALKALLDARGPQRSLDLPVKRAALQRERLARRRRDDTPGLRRNENPGCRAQGLLDLGADDSSLSLEPAAPEV